MKFSLVIPCYNEAANLPLLLQRCTPLLGRSDIEVILVDNGSTDNSAEVLKALLPSHPGCSSVRVEKNLGYGFGIVSGLKAAKGDIVGWTHADMQSDPQDSLRGLELFDKYGRDIFVKGSRRGRPWVDNFFTMGMSLFEFLLLGKMLWDISAQPTLLPRELFENWGDAPNDFALDLFAYYQARRAGLVVYRFPVVFSKRAHGVSHWNNGWGARFKTVRRTLNFSMKIKAAKPPAMKANR